MNKVLFFLASLFLVSSASAMGLDWTGGYRFEWNEIQKPSLATPNQSKSYGTNYLYLMPKIIAADGVNIVSRFEIFGSQTAAYQSSQLGQTIGLGNNLQNASPGGNTFEQSQAPTQVRVSQLYLNINQEFGSLIAGRVPYQFGLGITHNSGQGMFDHWMDTKDLVGYKFIVGNIFFMPMIGRVIDADYGQGNFVQEQLFQIEYNNADSKSQMGIVIEKRTGSSGINSSNAVKLGGTGATQTGDFNWQRSNFIFGREWDSFNFKFEAGFVSGDTGVSTSAGAGVKLNGYGLATEMNFPRPESKWEYQVKLGVASGDDPNTSDYEGYQFDRNFEVGLLLFNHRLGQKDFLRSNIAKDTTNLSVGNSADDEMVSNAAFLAPKFIYKMNDKLDWNTTVVLAQLMANPTNSVGFDKNLGVELDMELVYKPVEKIRWVNQFGLLLPGAAFKDGATGLEAGTAYGFASKAAIIF